MLQPMRQPVQFSTLYIMWVVCVGVCVYLYIYNLVRIYKHFFVKTRGTEIHNIPSIYDSYITYIVIA